MTTDSAKQIRLRLRDDFEFYAKTCLKIRTKEGELRPLILNKVQRELLKVIEEQYQRTGKVRVVVLKGRQQGLSTVSAGYLYFRLSQSFNKKGLIAAHKHDSTKSIFDMISKMHEQCPPALRPSEKVSRRTEKVFDRLNTGLMVATAGGDGVARGETITHAMLSEVAFWSAGTAGEVFNALIQSIPNAKDTCIIVESTAQGYNLFKDIYDGACRGDTGFIPFFAPWYWTDEYRETPPPHWERTIEEEELVEEYGLDDAQLAWRRMKIAQPGGRLKFEQEFPISPEEAFKASGHPVFNPKDVEHQRDNAKHIHSTMRMNPTNGLFEEFPGGELTVYVPHDPTDLYTIGADVAQGNAKDWSVAQVLNSKMEQVAIWRGKIFPKAYAHLLDGLGRYYTGSGGQPARLAVESNSFGHTVVTELNELAYPNLFTEVKVGTLEGDIPTETIGIRTTQRTKPLIISRLMGALSDNEIKLNDNQTISELFTYVIDENYKMKAISGKNDDCVMALAIATYAWEGMPELIDYEWVANSYYDAI